MFDRLERRQELLIPGRAIPGRVIPGGNPGEENIGGWREDSNARLMFPKLDNAGQSPYRKVVIFTK